MPTAQEEFDAILAGAGMPAMSAAPPPMEGGNAQAEFDAILRRDRGEQFRAIEPLAQMQWVQDSVRQRAFRKGAGYDVPDADTFLTQMERDFEQEWVGSPHGFRPPPQRDMKVLALPSDAERKAPDFGAEATRLMRAYDMAQEFMATSDMGLAERGLKDVSSDLRPYVLHAIYDIAQHQGRQTPQEEGLRAGGRAFQRGGQEAVENFESFWREQVVPKYEGIPKGEVERDRFMRQARSARRGVEPLATSMVGIAVTDAISMSVRQVPGLAAAMAAGPHAGAAYWLTQEAPSMFDELVEGGVEPELAQPIALLAGALMAYTEMIEVNPLMPKGSGKVVGNYVARSTGQRIRQYGRRALIGLGKENLEEWLQGGEGLAAKWLASKMSKTAPDVDWVKELENTRRELARAFVSLPVMMGPGQMIGAVGGAVRARAAGLPWRAQLTAADIEAIAKLDTSTRTELAKALRVDRNELTKLFPQTATREGRAKLWGAAKYLMETEEQPNAVQEQAAQAQPVEAQPEVAGAAPQAEVADAAPTAAPGGTMAEAAAAADAAAEAPAEEGVRPHHLATAATPTQVTATQVTAASRLSLQHFDSLLADGKIDPEFHAAAKHILTELAPNMPAPTVLRLVNEVRRLTRTEADALGYGVPGQKMGGALTVPAKGMWRAIISLMAGDADATTVAHEWGHDWFRQLQAAALGGNTQAAELLEAYGRYHDAVGDELSMAPTSSDRIYNMSARMAEEMGVWLTGYDAARNRVGRARYNQGIIGKFMDAIQRLFRKIAIRLFGSVEAAARRVVDMGANEAGVRKAFGTDSVLARPARLVSEFELAPPAIEGRPDLANPAIDPNSRRFMDAVDEARKRLSQPVPRPDEIVQAAAQVRLSQDSEGEKQRLLEAANEGGQLGDVDTAVAKAILDREGVKAWESGEEEQLAQMLALGDAYRRTGTEQARAFRQRFDPVETPEQRRHRTMTEALFSPPQRGQKRLDRMHDKGDIEALRRERDRLTKQIAKLRKKLKLLGIDGETIKEAAKTRIGTAQVLGTIQAAKASVWDKLYEYWRNSILSAPTTQAANIIGNTGHMAWHYTAERFTEALVNTIWRRPDAAQLGEFKHILGGILPGLCRGAQNFVLSWKSELPFFEQSLGLAGTQKVEEPGVTIGGTTGRVVRSPQRLLLAADEFAKSLIWEMEVGAQAYRMAKAEGLSGQLLRQRIAELAADTTGEASQRAFDTAIDLTFQTRGGNVTKAILDARRKVPGLEYVVPFVTTPMNIFKLGVRKTPLGSLNLAWKALHGFRTGDWGGVSPKLVAEQLIAWAVVLVLMGNDEDDPWITGAAAEADAGSRQLARRTHPPMSVKVGGQWVSYSRIEPAATVLALTLDGIQAMKRNSGDALATFGGALDSLLGQVKDKTFLQGLGDLLAIVQGGRGGEEGRMNEALRYGSNFATSWVPNIVRSTGRSFDPYYPERGVWDKGPARRTRLLRRTLQSTELHLVQEQPAYDLWGRAVPRPGSPIPHTDWLWRMAVPINIKQEDIALGDRIIMAYNATAEQEKYPLVPSKRYVHRKVAHYMTDEQYAQFARESGQLAASLVEGQRWNLENVTEADMERLAKTIAKARQATKARLLGPEVHRDRQAAGGGWRLAGVRGQ